MTRRRFGRGLVRLAVGDKSTVTVQERSIKKLALGLVYAVAVFIAVPVPGAVGGQGGGDGWHGGPSHGGDGWHGGPSHGGDGWHRHGGFRHSHGAVIIGGPWSWDPPWFWGPPYYAYGYYSPDPPVVVDEGPQAYVQQSQPEQAYWYYCPSAKAYYPTVSKCPEDWVRVLPLQ
jgi:hypothetical protein